MGIAVGVDVGGTKCLGVALASDRTIVAQQRLPTPGTGSELIDTVVATVEGLSASAAGPVQSVGVGVPGLVSATGCLRFAPNLPGVTEVPVAAALRERLGIEAVMVDNDATCAGWAEATLGAAAGRRQVLMVALGTGIGGGLVIDGTVFRGANGFAGEIGHMVVDPSGPPCPCGQRGCWERFASGSGLGRLARDAVEAGRALRVLELAHGDVSAVCGEQVTQAALEGDPEARALMEEYAWWLALGLANLANALDPECIVIGGGIVEAGDVVMEPTRRAFAVLLEGGAHRPAITVVPAALGERAGAIGAALLARAEGR